MGKSVLAGAGRSSVEIPIPQRSGNFQRARPREALRVKIALRLKLLLELLLRRFLTSSALESAVECCLCNVLQPGSERKKQGTSARNVRPYFAGSAKERWRPAAFLSRG